MAVVPNRVIPLISLRLLNELFVMHCTLLATSSRSLRHCRKHYMGSVQLGEDNALSGSPQYRAVGSAVAHFVGSRGWPARFPGLADSPWALCCHPLRGL